jgi:anthranilate phosphoribosyltransferase
MSLAPYIRDIGRGREGARPLGLDAAEDAMGQLLDGTASDLEVGAFVLAMRTKGETLAEITGFLRALQARLLPLPSSAPVVLLPTYNGARRLPNLVPLLALCLAQEGVRVLMHGPPLDPDRVTTAQVLHDLGLACAPTPQGVAEAWQRHEPAYLPTAALCPALQRLLDVRRTVGVRNSGHSIAKLLNPVVGAPVLRVASYTHPEFAGLMGAWAEADAAHLMLLRGTEGEPVADPRRQPRIDTWLAGQRRDALCRAAQSGSLADLPLLPAGCDAASTARYIQAVAGGEKPAPAPLRAQVDLVLQALAVL